MAAGNPLARAERLMRSRKYAEVISTLEPQVFHFRENFTFYRLLGTACLYAGDYGGAYSYFQRAHQIHPKDRRVLLGLAAVQLRRKNVSEALQYWLTILDLDPKNARAQRGLDLVKRTEDPTEFVTLAESGRLQRLFPPVRTRVPPWIPIVIVGLTVVGALGYWGAPIVADLFQRERPAREGYQRIAPEELPAELTTPDPEARYVYSEEEIEQLVDRVGELFNAFEDNVARREANRILLSNAAPLIKERIRLVVGYLQEPTFATFESGFTYEDVASEPWLYEGCYVRWGGATSNISIDDDAIRFLLLVGYEDERILEGTVPVTVPFIADIEPGTVELIGRVDSNGDSFSLTAVSIRKTVVRNDR